MAGTVTLATLRTKVGLLLADPNNKKYSLDTLDASINFSLEFVRDHFAQWGGKAIAESTTVSPTAGTELYSLSDSIMTIEKVTVTDDDGETVQIEAIAFRDVERYRSSADSGKKNPYWYYRYGYQIGFLPADALTRTITVYYTADQSDLAAAGTAIFCPSWVTALICFKAASYACTSKGDKSQKGLLEQDVDEILRTKEMVLHTWNESDPEVRKDIWEDGLYLVGELYLQ